MPKKIIFIIILTFFVTSCADSLQSVKRGLTGAKGNTADEFLVKKKDPLVLPPDFENLPSPDERSSAAKEISIFEKKLGDSTEEISSTPSNIEDSLLKKIQSR